MGCESDLTLTGARGVIHDLRLQATLLPTWNACQGDTYMMKLSTIEVPPR